ncbi:hypothetical protein HYW17_05795 [Candidatus Uhrbacteria bacterium]|nr:hypothetical protein [Candidatus Uhrbacteria bacterium]
MRIETALKSLIVSALLAAAAFFYYPPEAARMDMEAALDREPVWSMRFEGQIGKEPMYLDLVKRKGELWLRIAYPPVKLLNNRWITLGKSNHVFSHLRLVKRLTAFKDFIHGRERYAFEWDPEVLELFKGIPNQNGMLAFKRSSGLPINFSVGQFRGAAQYQDPFLSAAAVSVRELGAVVAQLQDLTAQRNGAPKPLPYLTGGSVDTAEFFADFDQDGLSDALEIFWGTDPANPDSDNDTFLDGDEIDRGYNPAGEGKLTPDI